MLELEELICGFGAKAITAKITQSVRPGEIIFVIGSNGAGKTTLLKTLAGLQPPVSGSVLVNGSEPAVLGNPAERPLYLPAQLNISDTLTGLDIEEIYSPKTDRWATPRWSPPRNRPFSTYSSGEQRQVILRATLMHASTLLLLDEPFNFLDWSHSLELLGTLASHARGGRTFIVATHHLDWVLRVPQSKTWALIDTSENITGRFLAGDSKDVLTSAAFQKAFGVRIQILKSPLDNGHLLAVSTDT
ncbi:MAG TPA: ABC transporter ATP-binding protein [Bdellovibrionales bacterium]|nr:ABC transporter ATP-binding protein [Bdellovibrionales bacterium]